MESDHKPLISILGGQARNTLGTEASAAHETAPAEISIKTGWHGSSRSKEVLKNYRIYSSKTVSRKWANLQGRQANNPPYDASGNGATRTSRPYWSKRMPATHTDQNTAARSCKHTSSPICHGPRSLRICLSSTDRTTSHWLITTATSSRSTSSRRPQHRLMTMLYGHTSRVTVFLRN